MTGPNGKGKSTLLKVLVGLLEADSGVVCFDGSSDLDSFREKTEYLAAEENALIEEFSALYNVQTWLKLRGKSLSEVAISEELRRWNLSGKYLTERMPVGKFSTGMKRRLALCRLSLSPAKLWIVDEPLYGLDTNGVQNLKERMLTFLASEGMILIVSHENMFFESGFEGRITTLEI